MVLVTFPGGTVGYYQDAVRFTRDQEWVRFFNDEDVQIAVLKAVHVRDVKREE